MTTRRNTPSRPPIYEAAHRTVEQTLLETEPSRFERACLAALAGSSDGDEMSPAQRRYVSQRLDEEAVRRGLLLRAHWHCPQCGAPGSQWTRAACELFVPSPRRNAWRTGTYAGWLRPTSC